MDERAELEAKIAELLTRGEVLRQQSQVLADHSALVIADAERLKARLGVLTGRGKADGAGQGE